MNTESVHAFVLAAELGRFQDAADELGITQQAVSKRIAALERSLGVPLLTRGRQGTELTGDGQAFLPHARTLLVAARNAVASVQPRRRALRVDVLGRHLAPADLVLEFHERHPDVEIGIHALGGARPAFAALVRGSVDAAFCCVRDPHTVPRAIAHVRVYDEPLDLLVGPRHPLAGTGGIRLSELADHHVWVPGIVAGSEWGDFYDALAESFGFRIDATGPFFGLEHLLDTITGSATRATFVGARTRVAWSTRTELRRIPVHDPTPVYPHSLAWHGLNRHPGLAALRDHFTRTAAPRPPAAWTPGWARVAGS